MGQDHQPMRWFRFWSRTFLVLNDGDLYDYWTDEVSKLICPCHPEWKKIYLRRYKPANDNYEDKWER